MKSTNIYRTVLTALFLSTVLAPAVADNNDVVISNAEENYRVTLRGGVPVVVNTAEVNYQLNSTIGQTIQPAVYYGDFISLNKADCSRSAAAYKTATPENVFYDDTKVCFFTTVLDRKHKTAKFTYTRTFNDARYWARVYLSADCFVQHKQVTVTLPKSLAGWRIVPRNCGSNIRFSKSATSSDSVFTFTIDSLPPLSDDDNQPPLSAVQPHFIVVGPFANVDSLYRWTSRMQQVDCSLPDQARLIATITKGCQTPEQKISATYGWVQRNIRYVAYEAGVSGHRPDRPAEVLRKRYGDCKGMALLLRTLLRAEGIDARLADIGTRDNVTIRMSDFPCLAASNHVVCAVLLKGRTYWLDATANYTPYDYIPQHIQGQQALVENGDGYLLKDVPTLPASSSVDRLTYHYSIAPDGTLKGTATYRLSGDMKEYMFSVLARLKQKEQNEFLADNLNNDDHSNTVSDVVFDGEHPEQEWTSFSGKVTNSHAVQRIDGDTYIELNPHNNYFTMRIDTAGRKQDFMLPLYCNIEREVNVALPSGSKVTFLPKPFTATLPQGTFSCTFRQDKGRVVFVQQMHITNRRIALADIPAWNKTIGQWTEACNQQVIIH